MNRTEFIQSIGLPATFVDGDSIGLHGSGPILATYQDYAPLEFRQFTLTPNDQYLRGHFLWSVEAVTKEGETQNIRWYTEAKVRMESLKAHKEAIVRPQLLLAADSTRRRVDKIIVDASNGLTDSDRFQTVPNPDFNPKLPESSWQYFETADEDTWNPKTLAGMEPIQIPVRSVRIVRSNLYPVFDFDAIVARTVKSFT